MTLAKGSLILASDTGKTQGNYALASDYTNAILGALIKVADLTVYPVGTYWLIDTSGTKAYNSSGTLLYSSTTKNQWICQDTGKYSLELHATGGLGGTGYIQLNNRYGGNSSNNYGRAGSGGGGGGSGAIWYNVSLTGGTTYSILVSSSANVNTSFNNNTYVVTPGNSGGNGGAGSAGTAGSIGSISPSSGTQLCTTGSAGNKYSRVAQGLVTACTGGAGGSGGATIGSYGNGGKGSDTPAYAISNGTYSHTYTDYELGLTGCIIIRRTS